MIVNTTNKAILVHANDAIATVAYSRISTLRGIPTDQFVAEALAGHAVGTPRPAVTFRVPNGRWPDIGLMVRRLQVALQSEVDRSKIRSELVPEMVITGWKWHAGPGGSTRNSMVKLPSLGSCGTTEVPS